MGVEAKYANSSHRLKLKLYRSLGIDVEPDADGRFTKAIVCNEKEGSAHVVEIDPQFSRTYYANRFWGAT